MWTADGKRVADTRPSELSRRWLVVSFVSPGWVWKALVCAACLLSVCGSLGPSFSFMFCMSILPVCLSVHLVYAVPSEIRRGC